jgi:lysozyme
MNESDFIAQLKRHEGYRGHVYVDTEGVLTAGWGHALHVGSTVPRAAAELFLAEDLATVRQEFLSLGLELDPVREYVIKNMLFNLGLSRLKGFCKMLAAVRVGDYARAADEMLDSKWACQVKGRAVELAEMMRTGEYRRPR